MVRDADEFVKQPLAQRMVIAVTENMGCCGSERRGCAGCRLGARLRAAHSGHGAGDPALRIKLYIPGAIAGLRLLREVKPKSFIQSYVKPRMLTHDQEQVQSYAER